MAKRATSKDVADRAGVSKWTVIRAFTPGASIAPDSRDRVLNAAAELNYTPNLLARSLATRLTRQVAVFVDDFDNPHKLPFLERLTDRLQAEGHVALLININRHFNHVHALLTADQRQVDAVILFGTAFRDEMLRDNKLKLGTLPMFVVARDSRIEGIPAITCDAGIAMAELLAYLDKRPVRRPAFLSGPRTLSTALGRKNLFVDHWQGRGIGPVADLPADSYGRAAGAAAARAYFSSVPADARADLLMCENDILALGAMDVIRFEFGLRIPEDIAVVGFDNIPEAAAPTYDLTTYEQPVDELATATVAMVLGERPAETLLLPGRLVARGSA